MAYKRKPFKQNPGNFAACYYRYSSDAQRDESIDQQRQAAHEYAERNGLIIPPGYEYEDRAITGTTLERPGLQHMLYELKHKRPAYLIVWKLDRLSRDTHDSILIDAQLLEMGVKTVTVGEILPEDEGVRMLMHSFYAFMAESFIRNHRSNVLRGLNHNAQKALYNGMTLLGYKGEKNKKYEIDPQTAPIVQKIFTDYAEGKPLQKIANELNESGLRNVRGNKFVVNSLAKTLRNRAYIGEYKWGEYTIPDGMPQLVSFELFEAANKMLAKNKRGGKAAARKLEPDGVDFWLTGHIYCGECGAPLHGISGTSKSGKLYYYYTCQHHQKRQCAMGNQPKGKLETIVRYALERMLQDSALRYMIAEICYTRNEESKGDKGAYLSALKNNLKIVEDKLRNFAEAIGAGIFNETTQQIMKELENQKHFLKEQIASEELREQCDIKLETIVKYFNSFVGNIDDEDVRSLVLDIFVDKIYIYKEKMVITCHFTEDKQELSYAETLEMIENHEYLMDTVNNPEAHFVSSPVAEKMRESLVGHGGENPDFFQ